jgi:hypothetical protein
MATISPNPATKMPQSKDILTSPLGVKIDMFCPLKTTISHDHAHGHHHDFDLTAQGNTTRPDPRIFTISGPSQHNF